jgi:hypothetical protein
MGRMIVRQFVVLCIPTYPRTALAADRLLLPVNVNANLSELHKIITRDVVKK